MTIYHTMINTSSPSTSPLSSQSAPPDPSPRTAHAPESDPAEQGWQQVPSRNRWRGGEALARHRVERTFGTGGRRGNDDTPERAENRTERHARDAAPERAGRAEESPFRLPPNLRRVAQREPTVTDMIHEACAAKKRDARALYGGEQYVRLLRMPIEDNKRPLDLRLYVNVLAGAMEQLGQTALTREQIRDRTERTREALARAAAHCLRNRGVLLDSADWRQNAMFCNAFSKVEKDGDCWKVCGYIASRFKQVPDHLLDEASAQSLSMLGNGFSKFMGHPSCRDAVAHLAKYVMNATRQRVGEEFTAQGLSNLANAFGKWPQGEWPEAVRGAMSRLAREFGRRADGGKVGLFDAQGLANLANAFGKLAGDGHCQAALAALAAETVKRASEGGMGRFQAQQLSNLANAFDKLGGDGDRQAVLATLAAETVKRASEGGMTWFNEQELSNLANAFCKPPDEACQAALAALAAEVTKRGASEGGMDRFNEQDLANLSNAFCQSPDEACQAALAALAAEVTKRGAGEGGMDGLNEQDLANLSNAFCKLPDEACQAALAALAAEVTKRGAGDGGMDGFNEQVLANLSNAFCKLPDDVTCQAALAALAEEVSKRAKRGRMDGFGGQGLATLAHAFGKSRGPECCAANTRIAGHLLASPECLASATVQHLAMLAHAFARHFNGADAQGQITLEAALRALAPPAAGLMPHADTLSVASLLWAYGKVRLVRELDSLAEPALPRIAALAAADGLRADNLERVGVLCAGLTPLVRSDDLRRFRRDALHLLQQLQPIVTHKLDLYLARARNSGHTAPSLPPDEACSTRSPGLSAYYILKAYVQVRSHWTGREVGVRNVQAQAGAAELNAWLKGVYARLAPLIERDLSSYSWNMIAQLESEDPAEALDRFVVERSEQIAARYPPATFDHDSVFDSFDHAPRPPEAGAGLLAIPTVDPNGRVLHVEPPRYSLFARLTQGRIQPLWVRLPERFSSFLLARTFMHEGRPYRFDLVGGSRMKAGRRDIAQLFAPDGSKASPGMLLALPAAETLPGSAYGRMMAEMFPNEESFYYFQRALMGSPPNLAGGANPAPAGAAREVAPAPPGHVLEGRFKIALLPDRRPVGEAAHPFAMTNEQGEPIALRPFDGCGFIREEVARRMPAFAHALRYGQPTESANLPAQALQHYLRNEAVADEAARRMVERLEEQGTPPTPEQMFRGLSAGLIKGHIGVAVPASDGLVHLPRDKSGAFRRHGGDLMIGKSPYDKPNLGWFAHDQVSAAGATARFLDRCTTLQYSFWVRDDTPDREPAKAFAKGLLIAVPEHMWPAAFSDVDMCLSADDVKMRSDWRDEKKRAAHDLRLAGPGQLQAGELYAGGSLVALPPRAQQKRDGDFDGDPLLILAGYPHLAEEVRRHNETEEKLGLPSLKPPKSHTPAVGADGQYRHSRTGAIMSMQLNVLTDFVGLQLQFLALPREQRRRFAEQALFGVLEGWEPGHEDSEGNWHPGLGSLVGGLLDAGTVRDKRAALESAAAMLRRQHDATRHPQARQAAALLAQAMRAWAARELPGQATPALDLDVPAANPAFEALFPDLRKALDAEPDPALRIGALLRRVPNRVPMPGQHWQVAGDPEASLNRLLAMGVKIGTDALKSNTGTRLARRTADYLRGLYHRLYGGIGPPPYTKLLARQIRDGRFDARAALEQLTDNPTLAAQIMEKAIARLGQKGWLPRPDGASAARPGATMAQYRFTAMPVGYNKRRELDRVSLALRERAFALEKTVTPVLSGLFAALGGREHQPADRLKSDWAIKDKIGRAYPGRGIQVTQAQADERVRDALRYAIVFDHAGFTDKALRALERLRAQFDIERVKNTFAEGAIYKGINITLRDRQGGATFEIQFHTEASIGVKDGNHASYRQCLNPRLGTEKRAQLLRKMREKSGTVALPDDVARIAEEGARDGDRPVDPPHREGDAALPPRATRGGTLEHALRTRFSENNGGDPRDERGRRVGAQFATPSVTRGANPPHAHPRDSLPTGPRT